MKNQLNCKLKLITTVIAVALCTYISLRDANGLNTRKEWSEIVLRFSKKKQKEGENGDGNGPSVSNNQSKN